MRILIILCILTLAFGFPTLSDKNNNIEIVSSSERRFSDLYQFQYSLSDGQERQETISFDDSDDLGIIVQGSYTLELADGGTQTIYYISDVHGHRVSIDKPFTNQEAYKKPIKSGRKIDEPSEDEELKEIKLEEKINEIKNEPKEEMINLVDDHTENTLIEENSAEKHTDSEEDVEVLTDDKQTTESNYYDDEDVTDEVDTV